MVRGPAQERTLEYILRERGVREKDIGWVISKLDIQEYVLDSYHYIEWIDSKESETHAKEIFVNHYFALNMKGVSSKNTINNLF